MPYFSSWYLLFHNWISMDRICMTICISGLPLINGESAGLSLQYLQYYVVNGYITTKTMPIRGTSYP